MTTDLNDRLAALLIAAGVDNARQESHWIAEDARDEDQAFEWAERRAAGEPLQYILGSVSFRRLKLRVGPGAFIPRPETELVAARVIDLLPRDGIAVDLCTGAGPIALSIAQERPDVRVYATDFSREALDWARRNLESFSSPESGRHTTAVGEGNGAPRIEFLLGSLFDPLPESLRSKVDVLVANPPYIAYHERGSLPPDVIGHEPHEALFAAGDGLEVITAIAAHAVTWLRPGGSLVLEIGERQGAAVVALLRAKGYTSVTVAPDLAGKDRVAEGRVP